MADIKPIPVPTGRYLDRVVARLIKYIDWPEDADDCWLWTGTLNTQGYGRTSVRRTGDPNRQRDPNTKTDQRIVQAHRLMWALRHGDTDKPLDHICEIRNCVNPDHLRRFRRKDRTECVNGHPATEANTYRRKSGAVECRVCHRDRQRQRSRF